MKRIALLIMVIMTLLPSKAVRVSPTPVCIHQSDGSSLWVRGYGDENYCYYTTTDGVLLYQEGRTFYVAEIDEKGCLLPSDIIAHETGRRSDAELSLINRQNRQRFYQNLPAKRQRAIMREPVASSSYLLPHVGSPKVPVILVAFSDTPFTIEEPKTVFNKYLNAEELFDVEKEPIVGKNYGSVKRYFTDMSRGLFTPDFEVIGPVTLPHPTAYYGAGGIKQEKTEALLADACSAVDEEVDFSRYDSNDDGIIDLVYLIYAGYSQSWIGNSTDCIWPKSGVLPANVTVDGKKVGRYGVNNELNFYPEYQAEKGLFINGIGLFCHEFSHCIGLHDLYPSQGSAAERCVNHNMEYWDLMDAGEYLKNGYYPAEYSAWERECFGWLKIDTLSEPANVSLLSLAEGGNAYRIVNDANPNEYYLIENIQTKGWNSFLFGAGMMVTHVDYEANTFNGITTINSTVGHPRFTIIPADGLIVPQIFVGQTIAEDEDEKVAAWNVSFVEKYQGQLFDVNLYKQEAAGDLFPGTANTTELTDTSHPAATVYTGGGMGKPITDIAMDEQGVITFKLMGGVETAIRELTNAPSSTAIYTLDGRRVSGATKQLKKGLYLINGKKIAISGEGGR